MKKLKNRYIKFYETIIKKELDIIYENRLKSSNFESLIINFHKNATDEQKAELTKKIINMGTGSLHFYFDKTISYYIENGKFREEIL